MTRASEFKIAIIGAGPAGLTLASLLTASPHPFNFTVFELRQRPHPSEVNLPCGNLDLQEGLGLQAIQACGLYPQFLEIESDCTQQSKVLDKNGKILFDHVTQGQPEISRNALTQLLLSSVPVDRIRWNTKVLAVTAADRSSGQCTVVSQETTASTSTSETFDLIVGADGAWSRARAAIPSAPQPVYSGVCYITLYLPRLTEDYPELDQLIGGGTLAICGDGKLLLAQRTVRGTARVCLFLHSKCQPAMQRALQSSGHDDRVGPNPILDANSLLSTLPTRPEDLRELLLTNDDYFASWSDDIKHLLMVTLKEQPVDAEIVAHPMHMLPLAPYPHTHMRGIVMVGDAAHLMTPFAGKGVNVAMADSLSLAEQLEYLAVGRSSTMSFQDALDEALVGYEEVAHPRAKKAMNLTWHNLLLSYSDNGAEQIGNVLES
jgi:2-polyprenyl-6-methoxyphenol hydroxylase-like FAD-dependent oxidoreductase